MDQQHNAWEVWRQDDHGVQYCVQAGLLYEEALVLQRRLEAGKHK